MCPKFQLEILTRCTILAIHEFLKNILESLLNVSETTSRTISPGSILYMGPANERLSPCPEWSLHGRTSLLVTELCPYCIKSGPISRMMPPLLVIRCCPKLLLNLYNRTLFHYPMLLKVFLDIHCSGGESLTHHGLKMPYGYIKLGQHRFKIGSGNDLLQYSTKPLPDPVSTYQ